MFLNINEILVEKLKLEICFQAFSIIASRTDFLRPNLWLAIGFQIFRPREEVLKDNFTTAPEFVAKSEYTYMGKDWQW
ncbi:hypothetical protein VNO78_32936 [Psophocarpus tetragonolobus]|uniref:Uncharacterized protein n=1 Tax=Psophocarpus tetragonolobus TaxID=3891 RepID=A0AAN9NWD8_PSOTE